MAGTVAGWLGGGMAHPHLDELRDSLGDGTVLTDADALEQYRFDWSRDPDAGVPLAVVRARTAEDVQAAVRWAAEHRVAVVPRGAGSGLSGGSSAVEGGLVVSLDRMRDIEIDVACRVAVVEPGALNAEVKQAAAKEGFWYPPDPSSFEICSIGGNVATNAGGLCCVKYGVTTDYVLGLDVVLADGTLVTLGGKRIKDVAGLSLLKLFVGSEGPSASSRARSCGWFPRRATGRRWWPASGRWPTRRALSSRSARVVRPSMMELMDNASINAVEDWKSHGLDRSAGALMVAQSDAPGAARELEVAVMEKACAAAGATEVAVTTDAEESEMFVSARRNAFVALEKKGTLMLEDVGAPIPLLPDLVDGIAEIAARHEVDIPVVAHAGDGNTHPIIVFDPNDPEVAKRAAVAFAEVMSLAISLGGTITGEHGVGRAKKAALPEQLGEDVMELSWKIKRALDPDGILNPGAVL